jgi:hypothetical protein
MFVSVQRCDDSGLVERLKEAAYFYGEQLFSWQMWNQLDLDIRLLRSMRDYGSCTCELFNTRRQPRGFLIRLNAKQSEPSLLATLAHEMIHMKQFAYGEMSSSTRRWSWKKVRVPRDTAYHDLPWEVEAHSWENVLYQSLVEHKQDGLANESNPI